MDIDEFYDADPRRRASEEVTLGLDWASAGDPDHRWDLFWVRDTGELYLMVKPAAPRWLPLIGGLRHPRHHRVKTGEVTGEDGEDQELGVELLAQVDSEEELNCLLAGWQDAVAGEDGIAWLRSRVSEGNGARGR